MEGDGEGEELVEEILGEVAAAHVGELVGEDRVEIFGEERGVEVRGEQEGGAADAEGDGAGDLGGFGDESVGYGEELGIAVVALASGAGEIEGLGAAAKGCCLVDTDGESNGEEDECGEVEDRSGG
jgi:hypothetical protein